jgi:hypothetical protein
LVDMLDLVHGLRALQGRPDRGRHARLWPWSRMTDPQEGTCDRTSFALSD